MTSTNSFEEVAAMSVGMDILLSKLPPERIFQYHPYLKEKSIFHVPTIRKKYLYITSARLVDLIGHSFKKSLTTVSEIHEMEDLLKVKFKKGEVISLTFKGDKVVQFGMKETERCLDCIRNAMTENGIKSNVLTNRFKKNIATAQGLLDTIRELEAEFSKNPSIQLVSYVMDLFGDAVELFGEANDSRYLRALNYMQVFLQRPDVVAILDQLSPAARQPRSMSGTEELEFVHKDSNTVVLATAPSEHLSHRLSKRIEEIRGPSGSRKNSNADPASAPRKLSAGDKTTALSSGSTTVAGGDTGGVRSRPTSQRRRSIRTRTLENAQFMTMDSLHFEDVDEWREEVEDNNLFEEDNTLVPQSTDSGDEESIKYLNSLIGNMTNELEDIIGEHVNLDDVAKIPPASPSTRDYMKQFDFSFTRGLSSVEEFEDGV